jgi:FHS family L-fucose permease-like MFS transporter
MPGETRQSVKRYPLAFALTVSLFAIWGGAHRIFGIVSPQFQQFFALSYLQSSIIQLSLNVSYLLIALPVGLFLRRFGCKLGLISGLLFFALGALVLYPAVLRHQVLFHVVSVVVTGIGWAFLEVGANTLIVRMGSSATAIRRLNFAQCFYPAGLIVANLFAPEFTLPPHSAEFGQFVNVIVRPYVVGGLGALLFTLIMESVEFPDVANQRPPRGSRAIDDLKQLRQNSAFRSGLAAFVIYAAAVACLWSSTIPYARHVLGVPPAASWVIFSMMTWFLLGAGRIVGTVLMGRINPIRLLAIFAAFAAALCAIPAFDHSVVGLVCLLGVSFFVSIMFPTLFARTIKDLGQQATIGAGVLVAGSGLGGVIAIIAQRTMAGFPGFVHVELALAALGFGLVLRYAIAQNTAARDRAETRPDSNAKLTAQPDC